MKEGRTRKLELEPQTLKIVGTVCAREKADVQNTNVSYWAHE